MTPPRRTLRRQFHQFFLALLLALTLLTVFTAAGTLVAYYRATVAERTYEVRSRFEAALRETADSLLNRTRILSDVARIEGMGIDARHVREIQVQTLGWLKRDGLRVKGRGDRAYWERQGLAAGAVQRAFSGVPSVQLHVAGSGAPMLLGATPLEGAAGIEEVVVTTLPLDQERLEMLALRSGGEVALFGAEGEFYSSSLGHPAALQKTAPEVLAQGGGGTVRVEGVRYALRTFPLNIGQRRFGSYAVLWPVEGLLDLSRRLAVWPLGAVAVALALFFTLYRRVIAGTTKEIDALTAWAREFSPDAPTSPPELVRVEELGVLSQAFTGLVRDLETALEEVAVKNLALADANATLEGKVVVKTRELDEQRRLLESVLSGMSQAVFLLEADRSVSYANSAAGEGFGDVTGPELYALCGADEGAGGPRETEVVRDGRTFLVSLTPLGGSGRLIWVAQDVTLRRTLELQLQQSQRLESVGRLAGGVAHDFNNVLGSIVPCVDILRRRTQDPKSLSYLETIESAAGRAADVVRQLLTFSRSGEFRPLPLDLNAAVDGALKLLRPGLKGVALRWHPGADVPLVRADETQIQQVVINLAINAVDAMGGKGTLEVSTEAAPEGGALLAVEDTGPGIPAHQRDKVFDPFYTTKEPGKGTGLGLSIVYGVVDRHGGRVWVAAPRGSGARFEVELPALRPADAPRPESAVSLGTVLLVDDEPLLLDSLAEALGGLGFQVLACASGAEALERFDDAGATIDAAVIDLRLPQVSGVQVARSLRERRPTLPVVFMSGFVDQHREELSAFGDAPVLPKPFAPSQLVKTLEPLLHA
jgi:nitrogen-specific signal transduction histidine kinase/CheY-like chemotaxis protein/PAS domain-containing protein